MVIGVLCLQGAFREHIEAFGSLGASCVEIRTSENLAGVTALCLPGGESTVIGQLAHNAGLSAPIGDLITHGIPVFGTCAGAILLAKRVVERDGSIHNGTWPVIDIQILRNAYGSQLASFEADLEISQIAGGGSSGGGGGSKPTGGQSKGAPFEGVFIRAPLIQEVGPHVSVLASHGAHPVLVRQGNVMVATFHPELSGDLRLHELFLSLLTTSKVRT